MARPCGPHNALDGWGGAGQGLTVMPTKRPPIVSRDTAAPAAGVNQFKDAWTKVQGFVVDLGTIDVTTLQAEVTIELANEQVFAPNELFKHLTGKIGPGSKLTLVAHTHVAFDLDAVMIVQPGADAKLLEAHNQVVQTAVEARQAVVRLAREFIS